MINILGNYADLEVLFIEEANHLKYKFGSNNSIIFKLNILG